MTRFSRLPTSRAEAGKKVGIYELLGYAMTGMGIGYENLLPLPWDKMAEKKGEKENAPLSQAERRARMEALVARLGGSV